MQFKDLARFFVVNTLSIVRMAIFGLINFVIGRPKLIIPKSILLIRLDAIGDYILFRNFIEVLKKVKNIKIMRLLFWEIPLGKTLHWS